MATYIDDTAVLAALAGALKIDDVADVPDSAVANLAARNQGAYDLIRAKLLGRGYTPAQIDAWDMRVEFNRDIAVYWCLVDAGNLTADPTWVEKRDRRAELDAVPVINGGVLILPGSGSGGFGSGRLSTTGDRWTRDTKT